MNVISLTGNLTKNCEVKAFGEDMLNTMETAFKTD